MRVPMARLPSRTMVVMTRVSPLNTVTSRPVNDLMSSTKPSRTSEAPMATVPTTLPSLRMGAPARRVNGTTVPAITPTLASPRRARRTVSWSSTESPVLSECPRASTLPLASVTVMKSDPTSRISRLASSAARAPSPSATAAENSACWATRFTSSRNLLDRSPMLRATTSRNRVTACADSSAKPRVMKWWAVPKMAAAVSSTIQMTMTSNLRRIVSFMHASHCNRMSVYCTYRTTAHEH